MPHVLNKYIYFLIIGLLVVLPLCFKTTGPQFRDMLPVNFNQEEEQGSGGKGKALKTGQGSGKGGWKQR